MRKGLAVRALPVVENPEWILALDFDGTMHSPDHEPPVNGHLLERIEVLREEKKMVWGVCTGRSMMHLMEGITGNLHFLPDFAVTRERELFFPNQFGRFIPDNAWNKRCDKDHKRLFKKLKKELRGVQKYVEETAKGRWVAVEGDLAGVVLPHADEMAGLLVEIERLCKGCQNLGYERNGIYLRFSHTDYGKGPALMEVAQRLGVSSEKVVAGGDNFNDLTMLTAEVSARPICPGNAVPEVKKRVREVGGAVGTSVASVGIVEALEEIFSSVD